MNGSEGNLTDYSPPAGQVGLTGPVAVPESGTLPVRGDLAHIALAERYLVAAYAIPVRMTVREGAATLYAARDDRSDTVAELAEGSAFEALDVTESWVWGCVAPTGPSGYVRRSALA
ncbi:hypothetical protein MKP08_07100 [Erythrobacter sp. LQ02-29]|uniref:hypothetical protein n=1 Tax=Erythrobacter sp. LQ02-29 TaxID=2920384 RepID=UPI001F4D3CD4|nr:hypothetical protein [Erythrobacter sp. LQ02-29]